MRMHRLILGLTALNLALLTAALTQVRGASADGPADTLRARAIELVDELGQVRAQLSVEASGEAVFRLRDQKGQIRVKLGANDAGSGLLLLDASTQPGIQMLSDRHGARMVVTSSGGKRTVITNDDHR